MPPTGQTTIRHLEKIDRSGLPADGGDRFNRLIFAGSPYLLQHAENPIDWYPWGPEAFARAQREDKPLFLSIGYSTCHWCHVMAHESFEDQDLAELMNRHFVAVKVDREERPDLDATYMAVCQMMTGSGGWPTTLLLTPDKRPFFAATYLPLRSRGGMTGLVEILTKVAQLWQSDRPRLLRTCDQVVAALRQVEQSKTSPQLLTEALLRQSASQSLQLFDRDHGGFGEAPKFPAPHNLSLLIRLSQRFADPTLDAIAEQTLLAIRRGGIYDQIGFGLHRYSVDARWLVPHFEKMLYDQALFILACLDAAKAGGKDHFERMARQTAAYVLRDLQHPEGGFYCGEDADSEGAEGTFYLWSETELREALPETEAARVIKLFQVTAEGNFEGRSILHLAANAEIPAMDDPALARLRELRDRRLRPHRDEKVLTGWNGLMIAALARTAAQLGDREALAAAGRAYRLIASALVRPDGRLLRRYFRGEAGVPGFLEDYAALAWGCLELYQAGFDPLHLEAALTWCDQLLALFADDAGNFFDTARDDEVVLTRNRSLQDGAMPSGISLAAGVLVSLGRLTGRSAMEKRGEEVLERHAASFARYPTAFSQALQAVDALLGPTTEATLVCGENRKEAERMLAVLRRQPDLRLQILRTETAVRPQLERIAPRLQDQRAADGRSCVYLCSGRRCLAPATTAGELQHRFDALRAGN